MHGIGISRNGYMLMSTITLRRPYGRYMAIALIMTALIVIMTGYSQADTASPVPAYGTPGLSEPSATPLIQCNVGLVLPLLLACLARLYGRARAKKNG